MEIDLYRKFDGKGGDRIGVMDGDTAIINKKIKVALCEMETVTLTAKMLSEVKGDTLSFGIEFDK